MQKIVISITILFIVGCACDASDRKARGQAAWAWASVSAKPASAETTKPAVPKTETRAECVDALQEVNDARKARGLPPFQPDAKLTEAALACARERAARGIHGHLPESDFKHLSSSVPTEGVAAGCAAWEDGFGACAMYDNYAYCGAAWVRGSDGLKYCHVFVRGEAPTFEQRATSPPVQSVTGSCASGSCGTVRERRGLFRGR